MTVVWLAGCADGKSVINAAVADKARADLVDQALAVEDRIDLPPQPAGCGDPERSGVQAGDRLDAALLKTDRALTRANDKGATCARWYDALRASTNTSKQGGAQ